MTLLIIIYWASLACILYTYFGYPVALYILTKLVSGKITGEPEAGTFYPDVSVIIPAYNEGKILDRKITNTIQLNYPREKIEILIISDGSTDNTKEIALAYHDHITLFEVKERSGKAAALNLGLEKARNEIVIFSDASIILSPDSVKNIVVRFSDPKIGCVSGEDHIEDSSGEGLYGKYELFLRNLESRLHSIIGASGSFYAQRKKLCSTFKEGLAPDFLSVLNTVEKGYRAVTEPRAHGTMKSSKNIQDETGRKVRTLIRGMTTLSYKRNLLNPFKFGIFSFELISHKLLRWMVPFFLISLLAVNIPLAQNPYYLSSLILQIIFYTLFIAASFRLVNLHNKAVGRIPLFFVMVNMAILIAWYRYATGIRQELWDPTKR
jgi:cellulose synthase/poly-beta-1,6-N-acetylglucosamine synthase-like glycosyltransferase